LDAPRIIKKYPNRRLYDTAVSSYITLEDVRQLVLSDTPFRVCEARTDEDITRTILLQIIIEQEEDGEPIFSAEVLEQIIRFYGDSLQGMMTSYLEKSLKLFVDQQDRYRQQVESAMGDPLSMMREMTEKHFGMWKDMQDNFFRAAMPNESTPESSAKRKEGKKRSGD
jgi:polyhydroxyalkanoate synthesis repressor PhaR